MRDLHRERSSESIGWGSLCSPQRNGVSVGRAAGRRPCGGGARPCVGGGDGRPRVRGDVGGDCVGHRFAHPDLYVKYVIPLFFLHCYLPQAEIAND
jgi:hypothetical protein